MRPNGEAAPRIRDRRLHVTRRMHRISNGGERGEQRTHTGDFRAAGSCTGFPVTGWLRKKSGTTPSVRVPRFAAGTGLSGACYRSRCGHQATLGPALVVVGRHDREDAHLANPPDSIGALGESILDHVDPERRGAGGVVAEHVEHDTARAPSARPETETRRLKISRLLS